jgi:two-component system phosphate regulon sensor histidine kinase PhoR
MEDARLLSMMARQASAVLVTSQLYWKELERSKRIISMIESTSVGLMAVSPRGTVTQVNAAARRALGVDDDTWFGQPYRELIANNEICNIIEEALGGHPSETQKELSMMVKDPEAEEAEERIYRVQIDQIRAENRDSMGWVIVFEDVTDIRQAERMMSVFVDMVSHELRTPLTSIRGFVATLLQAGEGIFDWETQEEFLQIVDTEAERLGFLIDDLLNIARIQNGRGLQLHFTATELPKVVEGVIRLQRQTTAMKGGHTIAVEVPEDMPTMLADDGKLQQILHNLVGNALKYSPQGGTVTIGACLQDDGVLLTVKDQGIGIPAEQLPRMFGQFFRVESNNHTGIKGTGLGLWLTKHMVDGHHGRIWVESEFGHGSTFCVWLPLDPNVHGGESNAE